MSHLKESIVKAARGLGNSVPMLLGVILLISLVNTLIPFSFYKDVFTGNMITDPVLGTALGSILAGNPITSYILGGEFLEQGVSLLAVTAFLVAWVTVGIVQIPAESVMLGKRFALIRNINAFIFSIIIAVLTVLGAGLL